MARLHTSCVSVFKGREVGEDAKLRGYTFGDEELLVGGVKCMALQSPISVCGTPQNLISNYGSLSYTTYNIGLGFTSPTCRLTYSKIFARTGSRFLSNAFLICIFNVTTALCSPTGSQHTAWLVKRLKQTNPNTLVDKHKHLMWKNIQRFKKRETKYDTRKTQLVTKGVILFTNVWFI